MSTSIPARHDVPLIPRDRFDAVLFDMDGVITKTATLHCAAWKQIFDALLETIPGQTGGPFTETDYLNYVDGRTREDGVRAFLTSRSIDLPYGTPDDLPGLDTMCAVAQLKDAQFLRLLHERGVEVYESTILLIHDLKAVGIRVAVVTASKNGAAVLSGANVLTLFDVRVDGIDQRKLNLKGKPAPDMFLEAARQVGVQPDRAVVIEDAEAGVAAGRNGGFGLVIGVARHNNAGALKEHGADVVVRDLQEVSVPGSKAEPTAGAAVADDLLSDATWIVDYDEFIPALEQQRESLCTLGNGYFATRGASPAAHADRVHYPGTYLAGGYNSVWLDVGSKSFFREELVNLPNWLPLVFRIDDDEWCRLEDVEILKFSQRLNLKEGVLYRDITVRDRHGRETAVEERRFVHMSRYHVGGLQVKVTPINWSGRITVRSALDGGVVNDGNKEGGQRHFDFVESGIAGDMMWLQMITSESRLTIVEAARTQLFLDGSLVSPSRQNLRHRHYVAQDVSLKISNSKTLTLNKLVSIHTSRDRAISNPQDAAVEEVQALPEFDILIAEHADHWRSLWQQFDMHVETTDRHSRIVPSQLIHLNSFHTIQTISENSSDLDIGIPARGWTGEGYHGHVFWDDLFVFPFVNLRMPDAAAAILKYRHRRLPAARAIARQYGARGACYPWQSGASGKEQTPEFRWIEEKSIWVADYSSKEIHVNASIAYNIWQYYQATLSMDFMQRYGAEMLFEIARFFATFATYDPSTDRYHIKGVVGPDEYHTGYPDTPGSGINDNAYTNIMAVWTLSRAIELFESMSAEVRRRISQRINLTEDEFALWNAVSRKMFVPLRSDGVILQFQGYDELEEFPRTENGDLDREFLKQVLYDQDGAPNQYKVSKQADVLMLFYVLAPMELKKIFERLGYSYRFASISINSKYYVPRTVNDSTLSRVAHAWVLSRLDWLNAWKLLSSAVSSPNAQSAPASDSWDIFYEALGSDFFDVAARGTAKTGIHMGAMAGTLDIVQRSYTGLTILGDVLWLEPQLPAALNLLFFKLYFRNQSLSFQITRDSATITSQYSKAKPIKIGYRTQIYDVNPGDTVEIPLQRRAA